MTVIVRRQKVVIEHSSGDWFVMFNDGAIDVVDTADEAFRRVQRAAARGNRTATVTRIEWRNTPAGFVPPTGSTKTGVR